MNGNDFCYLQCGQETAVEFMSSVSGNASPNVAFDASSAFVPPPQVWTHAPLQTTEDLAAYLEHRTRLASGQQR